MVGAEVEHPVGFVEIAGENGPRFRVHFILPHDSGKSVNVVSGKVENI
jgi:hypothetical protein